MVFKTITNILQIDKIKTEYCESINLFSNQIFKNVRNAWIETQQPLQFRQLVPS